MPITTVNKPADIRNRNIEISYISALVGVAVILIIVRLLRTHRATTVSAEKTQCTTLVSLWKAEVSYAPIWRFRRAKEASYKSGKINFGQLPPRPHALCIFIFLGLNIFLITWNLPWGAKATTLVPLLRNRIGSVAVANMIPIVVLSTMQNPLIKLLQISYDSFNLIHRWIARITILMIITHGLANIVGAGIHEGWAELRHSLKMPYVHFGLAAASTFTLLFILSWKPIRSLAYELFHYVHMGLVIIAFSFIWQHLKGHYQRNYLLVAIILWALARASRFLNIVYRSFGVGKTEDCTAFVEQMPGNAVRIALFLPRPWTSRPGQSLYLNIPRVSFWASHPFSVAWTDERSQLPPNDVETGASTNSTDKHPQQEHSNQRAMYLIVKRRSGMTDSLFKSVEAIEGPVKFKAYVQGPHGPTQSLQKYGSVVLFAAGVGITYQLSFVKQIMEDWAGGEKAIKRVRLIWVVPSIEAVEWIQPWLHDILGEGQQQASSDGVALQLSLFVTRQDGDEAKTPAPPQFSDITFARPTISTLVGEEAEQRQGKMFVSVCASGSVADEVRMNVRRLLRKRVNVDFHEEGFGW